MALLRLVCGCFEGFGYLLCWKRMMVSSEYYQATSWVGCLERIEVGKGEKGELNSGVELGELLLFSFLLQRQRYLIE